MPLSPPGSPNYTVGRDSVRWIVMHTMDGDVAGATARFNNTSVPLADRVSAHYGLTSSTALKDGDSGALPPGGSCFITDRMAFAMSNTGSTSVFCLRVPPGDNINSTISRPDPALNDGACGRILVNLESIGIEHEDHGDYNGARPDALYATSAALVRDICIRYGLPIDRNTIRLHREIVATGCPDALDVDRIVRLAQQGDPVTNPINNKAIATFAARQAYVDIRGEPSVDELIAKRDGVDADLGNLDTMLATTLDSPEGSAYRADIDGARHISKNWAAFEAALERRLKDLEARPPAALTAADMASLKIINEFAAAIRAAASGAPPQ